MFGLPNALVRHGKQNKNGGFLKCTYGMTGLCHVAHWWIRDGQMSSQFIDIAIDLVDRDERQPRRRFDEDAADELARSIARLGIIQPVVVRRSETDGRFVLIAGERRWRAAGIVGLDAIPCVVREGGRASVAEVALAENVQRSSLTPLEEAMADTRIMTGEGKTQQEVADAIGKSRSSVAHRLRLLELPESVQALIDSGELEAGHGKALLSAPSAQQSSLGTMAVEKEGSVRRLERAARHAKAVGEGGQRQSAVPESGGLNEGADAELRRVERVVGEAVGLPTGLEFAASGNGKVTFHFSSLDEFAGLMERLRVELA